ncbi:MAG TPA: GNAT family N-acetyltransferase [Spirochaetota bacterium]
MNGIEYRELVSRDFDQAMSLWSNTEGMGIRGSDNARDFSRFLSRNPAMSFAAVREGKIVGTIMCGHDGRRGYIYHLAVAVAHRRQKIASRLVTLAMSSLEREEIEKCTLFVFDTNLNGSEFWSDLGWVKRNDLLIFQKDLFRTRIG